LPEGADEPAGFGLLDPLPAPSPRAPSTAAASAPSVAALAAPSVDAAPPPVSPVAASGSSPRPQDLAALAGFTPAWGVAAPVRALSADGTVSSHVPDLSPAPDPEPLPPEPQFAGPEPQFGVAGTVLDDLPSLDDAAPLSPDPVELDSGSDIRAWTGAAPEGHGGMQIELEPNLAPLELDRRPPPAPPPDPAWALPGAGGAPKAAAPAASGLAWDDPFSEPPPAPPSPAMPPPAEPAIIAARSAPPLTSVVLDDAPVPGQPLAEHELFEMPDASPAPSGGAEPSGSLLPDVPDSVEPVATVTGPVPLAQISKPPTRTRLGLQERELPGTARRISAVVLNVGLAALLLLVVVGLASSWATVGRLEGSALSPRRLLQAFRAGTGVTPLEVTPGTYETRSGRSLLYVRGRVLNRGAPASRVRIRAEVWDGAQAVKSGETLAGAIASPEELWRAATPADVDALRTRLLAAATLVKDGQQADFLVLLDEAPRDLAGLRLRVSATVER